MIVGGYYSLHLNCDAAPDSQPPHKYDEFPHQFGQDCETGAEARAKARRAGWHLNLATGKAVCPKCSRKRKVDTHNPSD